MPAESQMSTDGEPCVEFPFSGASSGVPWATKPRRGLSRRGRPTQGSRNNPSTRFLRRNRQDAARSPPWDGDRPRGRRRGRQQPCREEAGAGLYGSAAAADGCPAATASVPSWCRRWCRRRGPAAAPAGVLRRAARRAARRPGPGPGPAGRRRGAPADAAHPGPAAAAAEAVAPRRLDQAAGPELGRVLLRRHQREPPHGHLVRPARLVLPPAPRPAAAGPRHAQGLVRPARPHQRVPVLRQHARRAPARSVGAPGGRAPRAVKIPRFLFVQEEEIR